LSNSISAKVKESGIDQFIEEDLVNIKNDPFFQSVREELKRVTTEQLIHINNTNDLNKTLGNLSP
jgi:hypothetical protein